MNGSIFIGDYDNTSNYYLATTRHGHFARINNLNDGCYISFGERPSQGTFTTEKTLKIGDNGIQYSDDGGSSYKEVLHSGNYNTYSPSLTGAGASGSWGIDITGTASSANLLKATTGTSLVANT